MKCRVCKSQSNVLYGDPEKADPLICEACIFRKLGANIGAAVKDAFAKKYPAIAKEVGVGA